MGEVCIRKWVWAHVRWFGSAIVNFVVSLVMVSREMCGVMSCCCCLLFYG
jgi:hypothetical protein